METAESYGDKTHPCNLSARPHGFQQRHELRRRERTESFKNPLWRQKYPHAACALQGDAVLDAFEKKRKIYSRCLDET